MLKATFLLFALTASAHAAPVHLRTNGMTGPLGIDTPNPTFSWRSDAKTAGWAQSAYEVVVATDSAHLRPGAGSSWDSGKIQSSESLDIAYAGAQLKAQQLYLWKVITWDNHGVRTESLPARFETGLLTANDWKASWITRNDPANDAELKAIRWIWLPKADATHVTSGTKAQFRYRLHLDAKPDAASLHILVRGEYTSRVNGEIVGHHDEWGAFDREEIVHLLHAGDNEILLDVISHRAGGPNTKAPAAIAVSIHLTRAGAQEERIVTGGQSNGQLAGWQARLTENDPWQDAQSVGPLSMHFGIGTDRQEAIAGPAQIATDASLLRKDFSLGSAVRSARLSITALGAYQAYLNGKAVAPTALLTPGWTDFQKRVLFQTYDVTSLLTTGQNAIGVMLGGGWYSSPMTWTGYRETPGPNLLRAQLDLTLANGEHRTIATDATWLTASAPVTFSEIYGGESYDARLAKSGWSTAAFHPADWTAAVEAAQPGSSMAITAQPDLSIHSSITIRPVHLDPANAVHPVIYDMGQNMVGNVRLHLHGPRGTVVRLRYAERLNDNGDGGIYTQNLRNADATDTYVLSGQGEETWTPAFTFHGFRYVELSYLNGKPPTPPTLATIEGLVFNSLPDAPSVRLTSSSQLLNQMNQLGAWGQRGNFVSIPTDCPQRDERLGWMGDAGAFWRTGSYNFDIDAFTRKFMLDVVDAQTPQGAFTDVSPNILGLRPGAPGWGDAGVFIPYTAWLQYGDVAVVQRSWPAMERWMDFILKNNPDFIRRHAVGADYGDWLAPDPHTPKVLIDTAYWAIALRDMIDLAKAVGKTADADKYQKQFDQLAVAYRAAFVKADGSVQGNSQTAYLATLFTGIAPDALRTSMVDRLVADIKDHGEHLSSGFLGTPMLMYVLDENQHSDLAFKLLLTETYPSWGYMVKKGATTWWERWNGDTGDPSMNSYNHYAFGSVMSWVYRRAAGIDTDNSGPGFHHLTIHPHFDPALPQLHVEYDSAYGTVVSDWKGSEHKFTVTIPANTTATVAIPGGKTEDIGSGVHTYIVP